MTRVVVPVRFPLTEHSRSTLESAIDIADEADADLTILHINPYQGNHRVTRTDLKRAIEREYGSMPRVRYVVRQGFLVEQSILDEIAAQRADVVVIGGRHVSRWRRTLRRILGEPDIEAFLQRELDCRLEIV